VQNSSSEEEEAKYEQCFLRGDMEAKVMQEEAM
jgi:hypothetical protein